jgi:hypothetical protein
MSDNAQSHGEATLQKKKKKVFHEIPGTEDVI